MVLCPNCKMEVRESNFCQNCGAPLHQVHEVTPDDTKFCSSCGSKIPKEAKVCPSCGVQLVALQTKFCSSCGSQIDINAEVCPSCGVSFLPPRVAEEKNVVLAAVLSFLFPGLGHLYLGLNTKGISFIVAYIISAILILAIIGFLLVFIVWLWALIDSIKCCESINKGEHVEDKLF